MHSLHVMFNWIVEYLIYNRKTNVAAIVWYDLNLPIPLVSITTDWWREFDMPLCVIRSMWHVSSCFRVLPFPQQTKLLAAILLKYYWKWRSAPISLTLQCPRDTIDFIILNVFMYSRKSGLHYQNQCSFTATVWQSLWHIFKSILSGIKEYSVFII